MPFDPNIILAAAEPVAPINPLAQYVSMRDMLDERRYKRAQLEHQRLQTEKEQRELADEQAFRAALPGLGQNPSLATLASFGGPGLKYGTALNTARTAERLSSKAEFDRNEAERKQANDIMLQQARDLYAWSKLPDNEKSGAYAQLMAGYAARKWPTDDDLTPPTPPQLEFMWGKAGFTKEKLEEEEKRRKIAFDEADRREKAQKFAHEQKLWPSQEEEAQDKALTERLKSVSPLLAQILRNQGLDAYKKFVEELPDERVRKRFTGLMGEKEVLDVGRSAQEIRQSIDARMPKDEDDWIAQSEDENMPQATRERARRIANAIKQSKIDVASARQDLTTAAGIAAPQRQAILQISGQFDSEPIVKRFNTITQGYNFARSLAPGGKSDPAQDIAIIYAFAKAMDPESVVREGEYATVQKYIQSWISTYGFNAARILAGTEFLTEAARQQIKGTIEKTAVSARQQYENLYKDYGRRIETLSGVPNGTRFLPNYGAAFAEPDKPPAGGAPPSPGGKYQKGSDPGGIGLH